jgi:cardiolipin synthase
MLPPESPYQWLRTGDEVFAAKLAAIAAARKTVRLETYIYTDTPIGRRIRDALVEAARRGVETRVLVDAFGSLELSDSFWDPLREAGGQFRWFNPIVPHRFGFRDHRKVLVCDEQIGFIGGLNISTEYEGDGVTRGWLDHGLRVTGPLAGELAEAFDAMFARADLRHLPFTRLRKSAARRKITHPDGQLLLAGPGRGRNHIKRSLREDLARARQVEIITAYFLPPWRLRRALANVVKRGGRVRLLLGARSDVPIAQLAAQSLYQRLLRAGIEIYEYQPQILHAKLVIADNVVYAGSANLDTRSLHINYELMVRIEHPQTVREARQIFARDLEHALPVDPITWRRARGFFAKLKERWAYFILARVDPFFAQWQYRRMVS